GGGRGGAGRACELMEPVPGTTSQWSEFLEQRGEGVQHIGFWTPDLLGSLQTAVAEGGTLVFGPFEQRGHTVVQVEMPPGQLPRQLAYIDVGLGTVRFELIGPPTDQGLRQWLQEDYDRIIPPAPWEGGGTLGALVWQLEACEGWGLDAAGPRADTARSGLTAEPGVSSPGGGGGELRVHVTWHHPVTTSISPRVPAWQPLRAPSC